MRIETNNGNFVEIEYIRGGISVASCDAKGYVERRDKFDNGEIIMALNLLRNMRDSGQKSAYILENFALKTLEETGSIDYAEEYRVFQ